MREIDIIEECLDFVDNQGERVSEKFFKLIEVIEEIKIVHTNFIKKLHNTKFYELRIKAGNEYRIIIFAIDHLNFSESTKAVCLNGFVKKSNKGLSKSNKRSRKTIRTVFKTKGIMKILKAKDILEKRYGKKRSESRDKFRDEAYSYYFGEIIKNRRKEMNISQEELAQAVGKKRPYISRIENGEDMRVSNLLLITNALDLSVQLKAR